jgi:hypothetical protein
LEQNSTLKNMRKLSQLEKELMWISLPRQIALLNRLSS